MSDATLITRTSGVIAHYTVYKENGVYRMRRFDDVMYGPFAGWGSIVNTVAAETTGVEALIEFKQSCGIVPADVQPPWPQGRGAPLRVRHELKWGGGWALSDTVRTALAVTAGTSVTDFETYDMFHWERGTLDANSTSWVDPSPPPDSFFGIRCTNSGRQKYVCFQNFTAENFVLKGGPNANRRNITNVANNGSGAIRITMAATGPTFTDNQVVQVTDVGGTTEAKGTWKIHVINSTTVDLVGSTFTHAYTSGGQIAGYQFGWFDFDDLQDVPTVDGGTLHKNITIKNFDGPLDGSPSGGSKWIHTGARVITKEAFIGGEWVIGANNHSDQIEIGNGYYDCGSDPTLSTHDQNTGGYQGGFYGSQGRVWLHDMELRNMGDIPYQVSNAEDALCENILLREVHGVSVLISRSPLPFVPHATFVNCHTVFERRNSGLVGFNINGKETSHVPRLNCGKVFHRDCKVDFYGTDSQYSAAQVKQIIDVHSEIDWDLIKSDFVVNDGTDDAPWLFDGSTVSSDIGKKALIRIEGSRVRPGRLEIALKLKTRAKTVNTGTHKTGYGVIQFDAGAIVDYKLGFDLDMDFQVGGGDGLLSGDLAVIQHGTGAAGEEVLVDVEAISGNWKMTVGANTTPNLAYNISSADLKTALEALGSVGAGKVTRVTRATHDDDSGYDYDVLFDTSLGVLVVSVTNVDLFGSFGPGDVSVSETHRANDPTHESGEINLRIARMYGAVAPRGELWDAGGMGGAGGPLRSRDWSTRGAPVDFHPQDYNGLPRPALHLPDVSAGGKTPQYIGRIFRGSGSVTSTAANDLIGVEVEVPDDVTVAHFGTNIQVQNGNIELVVLDPVNGYAKIATTGNITCPAPGATQTSLTASLSLIRGQRVFLGWATDSATQALSGETSGLPYGLVGKIAAAGLPVPASPGTPSFGSTAKCPNLLLLP